ncbi:chromosome partitioning protein, ParB family [Lachnospiraceae bacterium YSD2013]|nr:chromosome partitioning protein, ParB family [Lachnospiraceae bacterium YSD2013]
MPKQNANLSLKSYDDIFSTQEERDEASGKLEQVQQLPLKDLWPFKNHPFKVKDDEDMEKTVDSIRQFGVLNPVIVRPMDGGGYEIVSGHRRCHGATLAGLETVPAIVRNLDDDAATILMVDSNLQRETILPSERAWAFRLKAEALKHQGERRDLTSVQVAPKLTTELLGEESGMSKDNVKRFIRLTNLIPELLEMVDTKEIAFNPAVELSYITKEQQKDFLEAMDYAQSTPSLSQAQRIKKLSQEGICTLEAMCAVMDEEKKPEQDHITLKHDVLKKYFPKSYTPRQMEDQILKLLDQWQKKRERQETL